MSYPRWLIHEIAVVVRANRFWMGWNLMLAVVPAVLAAVLFRPLVRHNAAWWAGMVAFVLFLPNAPYVVTDLIHLRGAVAAAPSDGVVLAGVLPLYAGFIIAGFLLYTFSVHALCGEVERTGRKVAPVIVVPATHAAAALGVVLGRMARLNSWDTLSAPRGTLERSIDTLTWRGAPVVLLLMFAVITIGYAVTSAVLSTTGIAARRGGRWALQTIHGAPTHVGVGPR